MNISRAVRVIREELPDDLIERIEKSLNNMPDVDELSIPGFGLWMVNGAREFLETCRRRLIGCSSETRRRSREGKIRIIEEALETSTDEHLWVAYSVENEQHKWYVINVELNHYTVGSHP